jgi:ubiquinone/menaquinone biosynthesis C-methylase UbiE
MPASNTTLQSHGSLCPWWLGWTLNNSLRRLFHKPERILADWNLPDRRAVDIGAGSGFFTLPLAQQVGGNGRVYAVDIQPQMLRQIERQAARAGIRNIVACQATANGFALPEPVDFALVFWMLHEVHDCARLVAAMYAALAPGGRLLFSEPRFHVTTSRFREETALFTETGFRIVATPKIRASRSLLLEKTAA